MQGHLLQQRHPDLWCVFFLRFKFSSSWFTTNLSRTRSRHSTHTLVRLSSKMYCKIAFREGRVSSSRTRCTSCHRSITFTSSQTGALQSRARTQSSWSAVASFRCLSTSLGRKRRKKRRKRKKREDSCSWNHRRLERKIILALFLLSSLRMSIQLPIPQLWIPIILPFRW